MTEHASSLVNGKQLDLSVSSLNSLASAPNTGKKFFDPYGWMGMSEKEPIDILRVVLDDPALNELVRPAASELTIHRRILHHMVCNIILPRTEKFDYITFLDMFVMYCLITRTPMNLGHLMLNHMKAATEKKKQGLPYGMFFTHMFHVFEVEMTGEVQEKPKDSKEYNKKTLRLMGFVQNDDGEWVKKGVVTPKKGGSDSEDEEEADTERTPRGNRTPLGSKHPFLLLHC
ncbi:hypothetical protein CJ030_MR1G016850 [Morella rubra]|uniref:Putative plant transposon protein domain-containing protein n=1 Tax=Morella rubra TaxID=262757 RepID=A0A6A1WPT9_9ROSI|nr:hypothetical protein CJ030_MR1G016850 [Morella rubra]